MRIILVSLAVAVILAGATAFLFFRSSAPPLTQTQSPPPQEAPVPPEEPEPKEILPSEPQAPEPSLPVPVPAPAKPSPSPSPKKETPPEPEPLPPPPREPQEFIIKILSFTRAEPANLTVRVGDTVTFVNEDTELHWPGADPHPTHSSLPTFDALGGISQGQSYSHTFRRAGSFGYHEHLVDPNPPTVGVITVLP